jgi:hypothetical protein
MTTSVAIQAGPNERNLELAGGGQAISPDKFGNARQ